MSWQQVVIIVWLAIDIVVGVIEDGKLVKRSGAATAFGVVILATILYTAGFWN